MGPARLPKAEKPGRYLPALRAHHLLSPLWFRSPSFDSQEPGGDQAVLYERLGVAPGASTDAIKRAFRKLALHLHPGQWGRLAALLSRSLLASAPCPLTLAVGPVPFASTPWIHTQM